MSIESAKAFYIRMTEDDAFRESLEVASTNKQRRQLIQDAGYDFTAEEWQAAITEIQASNSEEELNEEQLEAVAGGAATYGSIWPRDIWDWFKW